MFISGGERGSEIEEGLTLVSGDFQVFRVLFEAAGKHHLRCVEIVKARFIPVNRGTCLVRDKTLFLLIFLRSCLSLTLIFLDALAIGKFRSDGDLGRALRLCRQVVSVNLDTWVIKHLRLPIPLVKLRRLLRAPLHLNLQVQISTSTLPKCYQFIVERSKRLGQPSRCFHMLKIAGNRHTQVVLEWVGGFF